MPVVYWRSRIIIGQKEVYQQKFANENIAAKKIEELDLIENGPFCMVEKLIDAQRKHDNEGFTNWDIASNAGGKSRWMDGFASTRCYSVSLLEDSQSRQSSHSSAGCHTCRDPLSRTRMA
jgi:hypothetical protein